MCASQDVCDALGIANNRNVMRYMDEWYVCIMDISTPIISQGKDTGTKAKILKNQKKICIFITSIKYSNNVI